jgi:hypothetical protein
MTTNAGAETMQKSVIGFSAKREAGDEMAEIKRLFSPEFRNRWMRPSPSAPSTPRSSCGSSTSS